MDTVTHALSGALVARATFPRVARPGMLGLRARTLTGTAAAAFPDIDFVAGFLGPLVYLNTHRGITHSILLLPVWAFLLAALFARLGGRNHGWRAYYGVCLLSIAAHITGDVITSYGTKVLAPLSDYSLALPTTFIIDPWFTGIIVMGLLLSVFRQPRTMAMAGLAVLAAYVGFQGLLHQQALGVGKEYAAARGLSTASVHALPQPLSPFNWKIVVIEDAAYHETYVNLAARAPRLAPPPDAPLLGRIAAAYQPPTAASWRRLKRFGDVAEKEPAVRSAWQQKAFAGFRDFAVLPVLYRIDQHRAETCVWFTDLRFVLPDVTPPFRYGMCQPARGNTWHLKRLSRGSIVDAGSWPAVQAAPNGITK